jgi:CheY-like chemotaxis protein/Tfp pilus assembly protein PilF
MDLSRKRVLVVDDHPGMLASLRRSLEACGIGSPHTVRSAHDAVQRLRNMRYDIVLADFDLGPGPDGQQLLEHCRLENLLAPCAVFVMVTAERTYDRVMSAAEFAPDDYLVKPFTEDTLRLRLNRALERKQSLEAVYALKAKGSLDKVVAACDAISASDPRHAPEAGRLKTEALIELGRFSEARVQCESLLARRPVPWARLAKARALEGLGEVEAARAVLTELLADAPEYLAAYDALSQLHGRTRNDEDAKSVLRMALEVSPNAVHRHKAIGELALRTDDLETAEAAFGTVVRKGRYGFVRTPDDHLRLSRIYMDRNKFAQALETLAEVKKSFQDSPAVKVTAAAVETLIHSKADNPREARKALAQALEARKDHGVELSGDSALELARACYLHNQEHAGAEIVQRLVANNHDDDALIESVRAMFGEIDRAELGEALIERSVDDAVSVNNEGVARAKRGDLDGAIELLEEAAANMPDNAHIVMNAAHALIAHMQLHGLQPDKQAQVAAYLERVRLRNPTHPKYLQVLALNAALTERAVQAA